VAGVLQKLKKSYAARCDQLLTILQQITLRVPGHTDKISLVVCPSSWRYYQESGGYMQIGFIDMKTKVWPHFSLRLNHFIMNRGSIKWTVEAYPWVAVAWKKDMDRIRAYNKYAYEALINNIKTCGLHDPPKHFKLK
jgi:hypothetical protein